jgi:hypothetical protein
MANIGIVASLGLGVASQQLPYPLINGFEFSFASIELKFALPSGLIIVKAVKSANYSAPTEIMKLWGTHPEPIAQTIGKQDYEADVELYFSAAVLQLQAGLGPGWSQIFFDMHVTYQTPGNFPLITDIIRGCRLTSPEQGAGMTAGGTDAVTRKYKLNPMSILYGGLPMLQNPLAGLST